MSQSASAGAGAQTNAAGSEGEPATQVAERSALLGKASGGAVGEEAARVG